MPRRDPQPNFARHRPHECSFCDADALALCAAFQLFVYSGGARDTWDNLRGFMVPGTGRFMGRTVWQLVCAAEGITALDGGKYRDGGAVPTPRAVLLALAMAPVVAAED